MKGRVEEVLDALTEAREVLVSTLGAVDTAIARLEQAQQLKPLRTKDAIVEVIRSKGVPLSPSSVTSHLTELGYHVTAVAVSQAMHRLAKKGVLHALGGEYEIASTSVSDAGQDGADV